MVAAQVSNDDALALGPNMRSYWIFTALAIAFLSCSTSLPWKQSADFISDLHCGMSKDDVQKVASKYTNLTVLDTKASGVGELAGFRGETRISMTFTEAGLEKVGLSWANGFTSTAYEPLRNLCTGTRSVWLVIHAEPQLQGAAVYLDGLKVAELPESGSIIFDVPLGRHLIRLEKKGLEPWEEAVTYTLEGSGYHHLQIPVPPTQQPDE